MELLGRLAVVARRIWFAGSDRSGALVRIAFTSPVFSLF
jgi:hypothetical protein